MIFHTEPTTDGLDERLVCDECNQFVVVGCLIGNPRTPEAVAAVRALLMATHRRLAHGEADR